MSLLRFLSQIAQFRTRKPSVSRNPQSHASPWRLAQCSSVFALAFLFGSGLSAFAQQPAPAFSRIIVFGDSLSDTGNVRDRTGSSTGGLIDYPSEAFNYSDGRWTNSSDTDPSSPVYVGVWHEQLARTFLSIPAATFSLGGGLNFAFGGATTKNGTHEEVVVSPPFFGDVTITIDDMGKQMDDYLAGYPIDPNALYVVWGGGNDLFDDDSAANVSATALRASALMRRLAVAGAEYIMVPNVPPLGDIPKYADQPGEDRLAQYRLRKLPRRAQRGSYHNPERPRRSGHYAHRLSSRCVDEYHPRYDLP